MAADEPTGTTQTWLDVAAIEDPTDALEVAELLDTAPTELLGSLAGAVADRALGVLLQGGPVEVIDHIVGHLRSACSRAAADPTALPVDGRGLLAVSTLLTCLGAPGTESPGALARSWAPRAAALPDQLDGPSRHDWGLACAAHGLDDLVEEFLDGERQVTPTATLARRVVAAVRSADASGVGPAWEAFVAAFPAANAEGTVRLSSLLHAGWAVEVRLGGGQPEQVLAALETATGLRLRR